MLSKETSQEPLYDKCYMDALKDLTKKVSMFAIDKIHVELKDVQKRKTYTKEELENCNCGVRVNYSLPCRHILWSKGGTRYVDKSWIHKRWYLQDASGKSTI